MRSASAYAQVYGYTGRRWDAATSLWHYRRRAYSPELGRFLQRDPARDGLNLYAYVRNSPLGFVDPAGTDRVTIEGGKAYWVSEYDGWLYNKGVARIEIGDISGTRSGRRDNRVITLPNGQTVSVKGAQTQARRFYNEYGDQSDKITRDGAISGALSRVARGDIIQTSSAKSQVAISGALGVVQGAANVANGVQDVGIGIANLPSVVHNNTVAPIVNNAANLLGANIDISAGYVPSPDWSRDLVIDSNTYNHGVSKFVGGQGAFTLLTLGASQLGTAARLTHITTPSSQAAIASEGVISGRGGIFALSRASSNPVAQVIQTGTPRVGATVKVVGQAASKFKPIPITGPITSIQRIFGGTRYAPHGSVNLVNGATTPLAGASALTSHALTDLALGAGTNFALQTTTGTIDPFRSLYNRNSKSSPGNYSTSNQSRQSTPTRSTCFVAGTIVWTENGFKNIEDICVGDQVWSLTREKLWNLRLVTQTFVHDYSGELITVICDGESVTMTENHPILVTSGNDLDQRPVAKEVSLDENSTNGLNKWISAIDIKVGDILKLRNSESRVVAVKNIQTPPIKVYNITVYNSHTYLVGTPGIVVHNKKR